MCDPVSIGLLGMGLAGGGLNAAGQMNSAEAVKQNSFYQAAVAANNAKIAGQNAEMEIQTGQAQESEQGRRNRSVLGTMKAGEAASGVDVNTGSFVGVRAGAAEIGALNTATIGSNASQKAFGFQTQATSDLAQSQLDITEGQQTIKAAPLSAFGSLLSSASSVGAKFAGLQNQITPGTAGVVASAGVPASSAFDPQYGGS